jgi:carbon-monoxide dehydrogenase iron sulfur subunit
MIEELRDSIGYVAIDLALCSGCKCCMAICSLSHTGESNPEVAGLQVLGFLREGNIVEATTCLQCYKPECLYACPEGAIYVDDTTGARVIALEKCTGCQLCIEACPVKIKSPAHHYGDNLSPIRYDPDKRVCFKCDLCGGVPQCVKICPMNALRLVTRKA